MFNSVVRFVGSIKLAVPLLSGIVGILIWATFYESQVGSVTVQQEVYQSPWFGGLMFMLAVNLGISALSRYPWRGARKVGFALTHLGLIVIIAGSAAVIHLGMEGMLLVRTDSGAIDRLRIQGDLLETIDSTGEVKQGSVFIKQDGSLSPKYIGELELKAYTDNAIQKINFVEGTTVENPGIRLSLASDRMGETIERTLVASPRIYRSVSLGPADLELVKVSDNQELERLLQPQSSDRHPWGELEVTAADKSRKIDVRANQQKTLAVGKIEVSLTGFFPDFRLDRDRQPVTASAKFNNPAIALELSSSQGKERWYVFGNDDFPPVRTLVSGTAMEDIALNYRVQPPEVRDYFKVIVNEDAQLYYAAKSSSKFKSGTLVPGQTVIPDWADFEITLDEYLPHAQVQRQIMPTNAKDRGTPALLVKTRSGETWLPWGEASAIRDGDQKIYAAFSPKLFQLPFKIKLEDFIVERNEGSESVAMWTSKIRIEDPQTGNSEQRRVWMNHPTWHHGWKIAQASWNPGDLQQSTLQVKREPAWVTALTWIGSGLVILGMAVMFYLPQLNRKLRQAKKISTTPSVETVSQDKGAEVEAIALTK